MAPAPLRAARSAVAAALTLGQLPLAASAAYLAGLAAAAAARGRPAAAPLEPGPGALRLVTLVPAHDEEAGIGPTLAALTAQRYPAGRLETIVVADNCTDRTARVAADAGATVWERDDAGRRGKGQALAWALDRLWRERPDTQAVAVVDADCVASADFAAAVDAALRDGADAVQVNYVVANADEAPQAALRAAGFALMHVVRPRGKAALGLSCGLFGTGMAFSAPVLRATPWESFSLTEDVEYHLRLVESGATVRYVERASVASAMPTSAQAVRAQELRWESGNAGHARGGGPRLLLAGARNGDVQKLHAGLERFVLPQSALAAGSVATLTLATALGSRAPRRLAGLTLLLEVVYVVGGLRTASAPRSVWVALLRAPAMVARRVVPVARALGGRAPSDWVRTQRRA
jgi:hypothetical protein